MAAGGLIAGLWPKEMLTAAQAFDRTPHSATQLQCMHGVAPPPPAFPHRRPGGIHEVQQWGWTLKESCFHLSISQLQAASLAVQSPWIVVLLRPGTVTVVLSDHVCLSRVCIIYEWCQRLFRLAPPRVSRCTGGV